MVKQDGGGRWCEKVVVMKNDGDGEKWWKMMMVMVRNGGR